jgi:hypothetical protein
MGLLDKLFSKSTSRDGFAKLVTAALEKGGATGLRYNASDFSVRVESSDRTFFLENAYTDYSHAEDNTRRKASFERYVSSFLEETSMPVDFASARANLMPVVRDPAYFSLMDLQVRAGGGDPVKLAGRMQTIAPGLIVGLAFDSVHNIMNVNKSTLEKWNVDFDEALTIALHNLRDRTPANGFSQITPGLYISEFGDCYDSSRLLLPDIIYRLPLNGDPVIFAPNRDQVWVTGRHDSVNLGAILKFGPDSHFKQGHNLSPNLYLLADGKITDYVPKDPVQREAACALRRRRDHIDYTAQTGHLNAIYKREAIDVFVASFTLFQRKDQSTFSVCVWSNGIDSLLPRTDVIALLANPPQNDRLYVPWEAAFPIVSHLMDEQPELAPVRYRVRRFPDTVQLAELRKIAQSHMP